MIILNPQYSTTRRLFESDKPIADVSIAPNMQNNNFKSLSILPNGTGRKYEGGLRTKGYFKQNDKQKPLITVVTVVFNGKFSLEQTIMSVIAINYENVEYIIIDGGSTDGTLDVIQKYDSVIDYWVSEADGGIYDAMNKGITLSNGSHLWFLNSGDTALENVKVFSKLEKAKDNTIFLSPVVLAFENGVRQVYHGVRTNPHQGIIYPRKVFDDIGLYDSRYRLISDRIYFDKLVDSGRYELFKCSECIAIFPVNGVSSTRRGRKLALEEFWMNMAEQKTFKSFKRYLGGVKDAWF